TVKSSAISDGDDRSFHFHIAGAGACPCEWAVTTRASGSSLECDDGMPDDHRSAETGVGVDARAFGRSQHRGSLRKGVEDGKQWRGETSRPSRRKAPKGRTRPCEIRGGDAVRERV